MKIITFNANGIRSCYKKGFFTWLFDNHPDFDFLCIQETKAHISDIPTNILNLLPIEHSSVDFVSNDIICNGYFVSAKKKGYSGVGIYTRHKPKHILCNLGFEECDDEGRYIELQYDDNLSVISLYLPSGSSGSDKQDKKIRFMNKFLPKLNQMAIDGRKYIICGDWNIAHQNIDLKYWRSNQNTSGFLPCERQWLSDIFAFGMTDAWRHLYNNVPGYTWWSNRISSAYINDSGWRIDYQIISNSLSNTLLSASVAREVKFSDHAPLIVTYSKLQNNLKA